jgi:hypothetical protein
MNFAPASHLAMVGLVVAAIVVLLALLESLHGLGPGARRHAGRAQDVPDGVMEHRSRSRDAAA